MPDTSDKCPKCGSHDTTHRNVVFRLTQKIHMQRIELRRMNLEDQRLRRENADLRQRLEAAERERDALARITEPCPPGGWKLPNGDTIQFVVRMGGSVWWWDRNGIDYPTALDAIRAALKGEKT